MRTATRRSAVGVLAVAGALALPGGAAVAAAPGAAGPLPYTCSGGEIPSGTYSQLTVTGSCTVAPDAVIDVVGNVTVAAGAMLDAQSAPSDITVGRNVTGGPGSYVGLGCQPPSATGNSAHECVLDPAGESTITVNGNVTVTDAVLVQLNGVTVDGNVTLIGGGGTPFNYWSIKNNTIGRNLTVSGQVTEWLGVMFNDVGRNATLTDITVNDEHPGAPGVFVVKNTIGGNLTCMGLTPGVSGGFDPTGVNVVGRNATGQCADLV